MRTKETKKLLTLLKTYAVIIKACKSFDGLGHSILGRICEHALQYHRLCRFCFLVCGGNQK